MTKNERAALTVMRDAARPPWPSGECTGIYLCRQMVNLHGIDTSSAGAHRTAASLVRKGLAERRKLPRQVAYRITAEGRMALDRR